VRLDLVFFWPSYWMRRGLFAYRQWRYQRAVQRANAFLDRYR